MVELKQLSDGINAPMPTVKLTLESAMIVLRETAQT